MIGTDEKGKPMSIIERMAEAYLSRRGRVVLPRMFNGLAIGHAEAVCISQDEISSHWQITLNSKPDLIALNRSLIIGGSRFRGSPDQRSP